MERKTSPVQPFALTLTVLAALLRLIPHPPNFTPVGGVALFGGARLRGWQAYLVPIMAMVVTDPIRSRIEGAPAAYSWMSLVIYCCFAISVVLGRVFLRDSNSVGRIAAIAVVGSIQFFVITNFFVWFANPAFYAHNMAGLAGCYVAAIPFFGRTVVGDLLYSGVLFTAYALFTRRYAARRHADGAMPAIRLARGIGPARNLKGSFVS